MNNCNDKLFNKIITYIEGEVRKGATINNTIKDLKDTVNKIEEELTKFIETRCCLCGEEIQGYGNNPYPLSKEGRCCDRCNCDVICARIKEIEIKE